MASSLRLSMAALRNYESGATKAPDGRAIVAYMIAAKECGRSDLMLVFQAELHRALGIPEGYTIAIKKQIIRSGSEVGSEVARTKKEQRIGPRRSRVPQKDAVPAVPAHRHHVLLSRRARPVMERIPGRRVARPAFQSQHFAP